MKALIITEGGRGIGFGHITRSLSLYHAFKERSVVAKIAVNGDGAIEMFLKNTDYEVFNWLEDSKRLNDLLNDVDMAVIDSYLAEEDFYKEISTKIKHTVYIDDNARLNYPEGTVVNVNIYAKDMPYPKNSGTEYLAGPEYTLLRNAFRDVPEKKINYTLESVALIFGGTDLKDMMVRMLKFLKEEYPHLIKNVIIGWEFENKEEIESLEGINVNLIYNPDDEAIKKIMLDSDIAVSAGGQTLAELARVGIPTIGVCVVDNQLNNLKGWEKVGFLEYVGWYNDKNIFNNLSRAIRNIKPYGERFKRSQIGRKIVDGKGAGRLAEKLMLVGKNL